MSLIKRLTNAWNALTAPETSKELASSATPTKKHVVTDKIDPPTPALPEWVDDAQLRGLAQDCTDKITHWVIAGDFEEFYGWLDRFNEGKADYQKMHIELSGEFSAHMQELREKRWHDDSTNPFKEGEDLGGRTKTIVIDTAEKATRFFGMTGIGEEHIRLMVGGQPVKAYYRGSAAMENTSINFLINGAWQKIEFGMGHVPEFFGGKRPQAIAAQADVLTLER